MNYVCHVLPSRFERVYAVDSQTLSGTLHSGYTSGLHGSELNVPVHVSMVRTTVAVLKNALLCNVILQVSMLPQPMHDGGVHMRCRAVVTMSEHARAPNVEFELDCFNEEGAVISTWRSREPAALC